MRGTRRWSAAASGVENVFKDEVTQEELVKRDTPPGASYRWCGGLFGAEYIHGSVAYVALLLVCAIPRVTLLESLAVNQELILQAATAVPLPLCLVELIVFAAPVFLLLLVVFLGPVNAVIAMLLLLVGLEPILAFAATLTLLLLELPLSVVLLLRLHGCEVNERRRRQVVVWILVMLIPSLSAFSLACHQ